MLKSIFWAIAICLSLIVSIDRASACEAMGGRVNPFSSGSPLYDLYTSQYDLSTGDRRFSGKPIRKGLSQLVDRYADPGFLGILEAVYEHHFSGLNYPNDETMFVDLDIPEISVRVRETTHSAASILPDGQVTITSQLLHDVLEFTVEQMPDGWFSMHRIVNFLQDCGTSASVKETAEMWYDVRYADETIVGILSVIFIHEISHVFMRHFFVENFDCATRQFAELQADFLAAFSYYDLMMGDFLYRKEIVGDGAATILHNEVYESIVRFAFSKNAPIDQAIQQNFGACASNLEERTNLLMPLLQNFFELAKEDWRMAVEKFDRLCRQGYFVAFEPEACDARQDRLPNASRSPASYFRDP